jgi:hypothetical protein
VKNNKSTRRTAVDFSMPALEYFTMDSYENCLAITDPYILKTKVGTSSVCLEITHSQAYLLKKFEPNMKIFTIENYGSATIWTILDYYIDFFTDNSIQRLIRSKSKTQPEYTKPNLVSEKVAALNSSFCDIGFSFTGKATFKSNCDVEKVKILDFEDLFDLIDDDIKPMVPSMVETDRKEISNMIFVISKVISATTDQAQHSFIHATMHQSLHLC